MEEEAAVVAAAFAMLSKEANAIEELLADFFTEMQEDTQQQEQDLVAALVAPRALMCALISRVAPVTAAMDAASLT